VDGKLHSLGKDEDEAFRKWPLLMLDGGLSSLDVFNGFGNRFLWTLTRRSKIVHDDEPLDLQAVTKPRRFGFP
jgi:hypothetical protein